MKLFVEFCLIILGLKVSEFRVQGRLAQNLPHLCEISIECVFQSQPGDVLQSSDLQNFTHLRILRDIQPNSTLMKDVDGHLFKRGAMLFSITKVYVNGYLYFMDTGNSSRIEEELVYPNIEKLPQIESTYDSLGDCVKDYCATAERKLNSLRCTKHETNESIVWDDLTFSFKDDDYDCISNIMYLDLQGIRIQNLYYGYDVPIEHLIRINLINVTFDEYDVETLVEFLHSVQILEVSDTLNMSKIVEFFSPDNLISEITTPSFYYWMTDNDTALIKYDRRSNCSSSYLIDDLTTIEKSYCSTDNHTYSMWTSLVSTLDGSSFARPSTQTNINKSILSTTGKQHYKEGPTAHKLTRNDDDLYEELELVSAEKSTQMSTNTTEFKKGVTFHLVNDSKWQVIEVNQINDNLTTIGNDQVNQFRDTIILASVTILILASVLICILLYFR